MTHRLDDFDDIPLPQGNPRFSMDAAAGETSLLSTIGGYYDTYGNVDSKPLKQLIPITGLYVGQIEYLVDETGDILVDETGDPLIAGDAATMLNTQVQALKEKIRKVGSLWRTRLSDSERQWKTARLMRLTEPLSPRNVYHVEVTATFESMMTNWRAEDISTVSASVVDGTPEVLEVTNGGAVNNSAVFSVERTSGTITTVSLVCIPLGISLVWTGTLGAGEMLTIDAGAQTVFVGEAGNYDGLEFGGSHTADEWLTIEPGSWNFVVTLTGGNGTASIEHYDEFP